MSLSSYKQWIDVREKLVVLMEKKVKQEDISKFKELFEGISVN